MPWWGTLEPRLSQGDFLSSVPFGYVLHPPVFLGKRTVTGNVTTWVPVDDPTLEHFLSKGRLDHCVVLSHSCDLDKSESKSRVVVAPARPLDRLEVRSQTEVLAQRRLSLLPLPDVPELGSYYADLRIMLSVHRPHCEGAPKLASMTDEGRRRLQAQLMGFFCRVDLDALNN